MSDSDAEESTDKKIEMEIGVGVYDVLNPDEVEDKINKRVDVMLPESTE